MLRPAAPQVGCAHNLRRASDGGEHQHEEATMADDKVGDRFVEALEQGVDPATRRRSPCTSGRGGRRPLLRASTTSPVGSSMASHQTPSHEHQNGHYRTRGLEGCRNTGHYCGTCSRRILRNVLDEPSAGRTSGSARTSGPSAARPLRAASGACHCDGPRSWEAFRSRYKPEGGSYWDSARPPTEEEGEAWRRWIQQVFMPLNEKMEQLVITKADLLDSPEMPKCLLDLVAHVEAYSVVIAKWNAGDFHEHRSLINFPRPDLLQYRGESLRSSQE